MAKAKVLRDHIDEIGMGIWLAEEVGREQYSHLSEEEFFGAFAQGFIEDVEEIISLFNELKRVGRLSSMEKLRLHNWRKWKRELKTLQAKYA